MFLISDFLKKGKRRVSQLRVMKNLEQSPKNLQEHMRVTESCPQIQVLAAAKLSF